MGRRYRRRRSSSIASIVPDVVHIASRLPWWGALVVGVISYLFVAILLGGYIEAHIASQEGTQFHSIMQARFSRVVAVCNWVGISCLIVGMFFSVRNYFISAHARKSEKSLISIISKLIGRSID